MFRNRKRLFLTNPRSNKKEKENKMVEFQSLKYIKEELK